MSDLYQPTSVYKQVAVEVLAKNSKNGAEPEQMVEQVVARQLPDYERLTDRSIPPEERTSNDKFELSLALQPIRQGVASGDYRFVDAQGMQPGTVAGAPLVSALEAYIQQNPTQEMPARLLVDANQQEPYRYDRMNDAVFVNREQLLQPDTTALNSTMTQRADRSREQLTAELRAQAQEYIEEHAKPPIERIEDRVRMQAIQEGWVVDKPRLRDATVDAVYPYYVAATDPANPQATQRARDRYLENDGVTEATAETHPELLQHVAEATIQLNEATGRSYAPPRVAIVNDLMRIQGTPAGYSYATDMILLDADYVRQAPETLDGVLGHELGHRYQRSPEAIRASLHLTYSKKLGIPPDQAQVEILENHELGADTAGAHVVGAAEMKSDLQESERWAETMLATVEKEEAATAQPTGQEAVNSQPTGQEAVNSQPTGQEAENLALAQTYRVHPPTEQRSAYLDQLLAAEGVQRQNLSPSDTPRTMDFEGPIHTPAVPRVQTPEQANQR